MYDAASCLACYLMDKVGRRTLMIYSFTGMVSALRTDNPILHDDSSYSILMSVVITGIGNGSASSDSIDTGTEWS